jgi:type II secretory pathway component PulF
MIDTLKGLGVKLPLLTRVLMKSSALSQKYWYVVIVFPVVCSLIISYLNKNPASRYYVDLVKLKLPIYKTILLYKTMSLFTEQMRILIRSGMTIDRTFDMVADVIGNEVYKRSILRVKEELLYGAFISDCLKAEKIYPILIIRMVSIGENSGTLDNQFGFLSDHYRGLLDNFSKNLGKIIEPLVIIVVGAIFALIILGLMMPIYDLVSTVGKGASK